MDAPTTSLLILNGDCLDSVFQYFSLDELMLIFGNVHPFIDDSIERQLHRFRHFELSMRFPPQYNKEQLQALGRHLRSLNINVGYSIRAADVLDLLQQLLVGAEESGRLRALKIQHASFTSDYVKTILPVASLLHELDLSRCDIEDKSQFMLLLNSAKRLATLALYNKDACDLDESVLCRLQSLKVNWLIGTAMFDVTELCQKCPHLNIMVYQANTCNVYGPTIARKTKYFH